MAAPAQVTWAEYGADGAKLVSIGGYRRSFFGKANWQLSAEDAINLIELDEWCFFVEVDDGKAWLDVDEEPDGTKTLVADRPIKNLL